MQTTFLSQPPVQEIMLAFAKLHAFSGCGRGDEALPDNLVAHTSTHLPI